MLLASVLFWVVSISRPDDQGSTSRVVPDLVDVSSERAQTALGELDLTARLVLESSSEIAEGNVIRTGLMLNATKDHVNELVEALDAGLAAAQAGEEVTAKGHKSEVIA